MSAIKALAKRSLALIDCWRALPKVHSKNDIKTLVDFTFAHAIAPLQLRSELIQLTGVIAELRPERALEIGTCGGGDTLSFMQAGCSRGNDH